VRASPYGELALYLVQLRDKRRKVGLVHDILQFEVEMDMPDGLAAVLWRRAQMTRKSYARGSEPRTGPGGTRGVATAGPTREACGRSEANARSTRRMHRITGMDGRPQDFFPALSARRPPADL
jgi:hypothetical protein